MTEITRFMRNRLSALGVSDHVIDRFETDVITTYRGERVYFGTKTEGQRARVKALVVSGVKVRTAQKKASGR